MIPTFVGIKGQHIGFAWLRSSVRKCLSFVVSRLRCEFGLWTVLAITNLSKCLGQIESKGA